MKRSKGKITLFASVAAFAAMLATGAMAQTGTSGAAVGNDWRSPTGTDNNQRYSSLNQITAQNASQSNVCLNGVPVPASSPERYIVVAGNNPAPGDGCLVPAETDTGPPPTQCYPVDNGGAVTGPLQTMTPDEQLSINLFWQIETYVMPDQWW